MLFSGYHYTRALDHDLAILWRMLKDAKDEEETEKRRKKFKIEKQS